MDTLIKLREIIEARRSSDPEDSYVAKLFSKGKNRICKKLGEEATEIVIAALAQKKKHVISESADFIFHLSVLWAECEIDPHDVMEELEDRMGQSGLDEKAARKDKNRDS